MASLKRRARAVHRRLLRAYGEPVWRKQLAPLDELVSTILSQNTNDLNRDRAFERLRARFPTWEEVREAPPEEVIEAIRSAGLANQKGPRLQQVLRSITEERGGLDLDFLRGLPAQAARDWLMRFKGVGPKTAAIVLQFSLGIAAFPVDTHIHRVSGRLGLRPARASAEASHALLADLFPPSAYYAAHLNLIRHGREVCQARRPRCERCVLTDLCEYYQKYVAPARRRNRKQATARANARKRAGANGRRVDKVGRPAPRRRA
ncbi:MAG TPA: endonuclease III [Anaerolineales bacterium]